jgi:hypothetical protein
VSVVSERQTKLSKKLTKLDKAALKALGKDVAAASAACALSYTSDDGATKTMPILLAPALLGKADAKYLHRLVLALYSAVQKTAAARLVDPEVRAVLPMDAREEAWLRLAPITAAPLIGRFDMNIDPTKGARSAQVLEFNGCAIGGLHYGPAASATILARVVPLEPAVKLAMPGSMTEAWLDQCRAHKAALGRSGDALHIVWLEDRAWETGITEGPTLVEQLTREGHRASVCDPRDLELVGNDICHGGIPIDIAYRAIELRDLLAIEDETGVDSLDVMREAIKRNLVLSPLAGDLDHKSLLEIWTSKRFSRLFTRATCCGPAWSRIAEPMIRAAAMSTSASSSARRRISSSSSRSARAVGRESSSARTRRIGSGSARSSARCRARTSRSRSSTSRARRSIRPSSAARASCTRSTSRTSACSRRRKRSVSSVARHRSRWSTSLAAAVFSRCY